MLELSTAACTCVCTVWDVYVAAAITLCILTFIDDICIHITLSHLTMCTFVHVHCIQCDTLDDIHLLFPPHINVRSGELEVVKNISWRYRDVLLDALITVDKLHFIVPVGEHSLLS